MPNTVYGPLPLKKMPDFVLLGTPNNGPLYLAPKMHHANRGLAIPIVDVCFNNGVYHVKDPDTKKFRQLDELA